MEQGFLKAKNHDKMKFYLMWANHDANVAWDRRNSHTDTVVWEGKVNEEQFHTICRRWIRKFFKEPGYYKIDGKPVVSIYDLGNFISGMGGIRQAKKALEWLRTETAKEGFPGVHIQMIKWGDNHINLSGVDGSTLETNQLELFTELEFDSCTHYQFVHFTDVNRDYADLIPDVLQEWERTRQAIHKKEYYPHVSIGWDNNPRFYEYKENIMRNNTPEQFLKLLEAAKCYADKNNHVPLITVNSWNEWTETSYLEPDNYYGYGYLEAVQKAMKEETDPSFFR